MKKMKEIVTAWFNIILKRDSVEIIADQRMEVCNTCPHKIKSMGIEVCGKCYCPLIAKTKSPDKSSCPLNKWKQ